MRFWLFLLSATVAASLAFGSSSCGSSDSATNHGKALSATSAAANRPVSGGRLQGDVDDDDDGLVGSGSVDDNDADQDNDSLALISKAYHDADDREMMMWGRPARTTERRAVTALVQQYLQDAAAENGIKACSLIYTLRAESIPEDYGQPPGPPSLRGTTCEAVLTKLFAQEHTKLIGEATSLHVTGFRIKEKQGRALVGFTTAPAAYVSLQRQRDVWRIDNILPMKLP
jgi:hypothetical protein